MLNHQQEEIPKKIYQASMDTFYWADTFVKKSERNAKLAIKKLQLRRVKKAFGLDYMTLLEKDATPEQLDHCMREGHENMDRIHKDIRALRAEKASLDDELKRKRVHGTNEGEHEQTEACVAPENTDDSSSGMKSDTIAEPPNERKDSTVVEPASVREETEDGMEFAFPPRAAEADQEEEFVVLTEDNDVDQDKHEK